MAEVTDMSGWVYEDEEKEEDFNDPMSIQLKSVPRDTVVYEINGPMFFGAADKFMEITKEEMLATKRGKIRKIILRMRSVPAMDATAMHTLHNVFNICKKKKITLILSHVQKQPYKVMEKAGFIDMVGSENICKNIDKALERAAQIKA